MAYDIKDILNVKMNNPGAPALEKKKRLKKPRGMPRELWGLLWKDDLTEAPIVPSDTTEGYKQMKAKIGISKVRPWKWSPFTNPSRTDGAVFYHWRRAVDESKEYPFASFNKTSEITMYSDLEYQQHLHSDTWSRADTDHLFELCKRFDMRFAMVHDRWDRLKFKERSIEEIKDRYYIVSNALAKLRAGSSGDVPKLKVFDAEHEKKRKEQLASMYSRTQKDMDEEQALVAEMKKIESRKKERDKKTQDLQNLISAADSNASRKVERKSVKRKRFQASIVKQPRDFSAPSESSGIKFPELKSFGVSLRSNKMKLPATLGQKKSKAIEQVLEELNIDPSPLPTKEIAQAFNDLRQDIVLLYELKMALTNCQFEVQSLKHQLESLAPGRTFALPVVKDEPGSDTLKIAEAINVLNQNRKRKAALEQSNILKKIKHKNTVS